MEIGDLVAVSDRFGEHHIGLITDTVEMDEVLFIVTFFDGSEVVIHPTRVRKIDASR